MNKNIIIIGLTVIMLCMATVVVFAISEDEAYIRGYRDGYSKARSSSQDWQKSIEKGGAWLVYYAGFSREDQLNRTNLQYQFDNGFEDGWYDQRAGNRPAR